MTTPAGVPDEPQQPPADAPRPTVPVEPPPYSPPPPGTYPRPYSPPPPGTYPRPYTPGPGSYPRPYVPNATPYPPRAANGPAPYANPPPADGFAPQYVYRPGQPQWYVATQPQQSSHPSASGPSPGVTATMTGLAAAGTLSLVYAVWAFTARRSIFADFSAGRMVTLHDARVSDTIDTVLLVVAAIAVVVAVALWLVHVGGRPIRGGPLQVAGLALVAAGVGIALVGVWLDATVTSAATQSAQGNRGVSAAIVCGAGFVVLTLGLLFGAAVVRGTDSTPRPHAPDYSPQGHPGHT